MSNDKVTVELLKDMRLKYSDGVIIAISGSTKDSSKTKKIFKRKNSHCMAVYHKGVHVLETMDYERAVNKYNSLEI